MSPDASALWTLPSFDRRARAWDRLGDRLHGWTQPSQGLGMGYPRTLEQRLQAYAQSIAAAGAVLVPAPDKRND